MINNNNNNNNNNNSNANNTNDNNDNMNFYILYYVVSYYNICVERDIRRERERDIDR